eukprot:6185646-Pleurochrysis_carterae.AAC.1
MSILYATSLYRSARELRAYKTLLYTVPYRITKDSCATLYVTRHAQECEQGRPRTRTLADRSIRATAPSSVCWPFEQPVWCRRHRKGADAGAGAGVAGVGFAGSGAAAVEVEAPVEGAGSGAAAAEVEVPAEVRCATLTLGRVIVHRWKGMGAREGGAPSRCLFRAVVQPYSTRSRARERSAAATLASSSVLACWVEKGWSEGGKLRYVTTLSRSVTWGGCTKWRLGSSTATSFLCWCLGGRELSFSRR